MSGDFGSKVVARLLLCGAIALWATPRPALAQANLTWDVNGAAVGTGGTGTWDTTTASWFNGSTFVTWSAVAFDNAIFNGTAGTVTLGVPIRAHNLTFNTTGYTVAGGTLTLGGTTPTITTGAGMTAGISSVLAGTAGLATAGTGTLVLSGANTYTGATTINAGTLQYGSNNVIPDASAVTVRGVGAGVTATLDLNGFSDTIASLTLGGTGSTTTSAANVSTGSGTLTLNGNITYLGTGNPLGSTISGNLDLAGATRTITVNNSTTVPAAASELTISAAISNGGVNYAGPGGAMLTFTGNNTYTGTTTVGSGTLQIGAGGTTGTLGGGNITNNGILRINRSDAVTLSQVD